MTLTLGTTSQRSAAHVPIDTLPRRARLNPRVLVLGVVPSLTWSVVRCLSRAGMRPHVLGLRRTSPMAWVDDCHYAQWENVRYIDGQLDPELLAQVDATCRRQSIDLVLGADFPSIYLLSSHGSRLIHSQVAAVPAPQTMIDLHDKWKFSHLLKELGIPQPETEIAYNPDDLRRTQLTFPIITKPVDLWASVGFMMHKSREELEARIASNQLGANFPLLVQGYIPGKDVGIGFVARRGELLAHAAFEETAKGQRRYFQADALRDHVAKLLAETGYHGVGEIDTRFDTTRGEYRVLEVNPRFWASVLYASCAGMNFPQMLVQLDDFVEGCGFAGSTEPVRLNPYEFSVGKAIQFSERFQQP